MRKYMVLCILAAASVVAGCTQDKGNYDYVEVNELSIAGIGESYTVENFTRLAIDPVITGSQGFSEQEYDFTWYIYKDSYAYDGVDTLATSRKLDVTLESPLGDYVLMFFAREKSTGLLSSVTSAVKVINSNSLGLMALSRVGNQAAVTFINTVGSVTQDLYLKVNQQRAGSDPVGIHYMPVGYHGDAFPCIFIMTDDERGGVVVEPDAFSYVMDFGDMFYFAPERVRPQTFVRNGSNDFLINDGKPYHRRASDAAYPKFGIEPAGDYDCAPYLFVGDDIFVYDQRGQKFMQFDIDANIHDVEPSSHLFNPADMQASMVWGIGVPKVDPDSERNEELCKIRAVMQRPDGTRYLASANGKVEVEIDYETWVFNYEYFVTPTAMIEFPSATASVFALSDINEDFLYYAEGNRITCMSFLTGNIMATYTIDAGNVDYMEFDKGERNNMLYIGVSDGSAGANSGTIIRMRLSSDGSLTEVDRFENVCGQVVDFSYRD